MEGPFDYSEGAVPSMTVAEIWYHIREADPKVYFDLTNYLTEDERADKHQLLQWLRVHHIFLYETLENILKAFQTAYHAGCETRVSLLRSYHLYRTARAAAEAEGKDLNALIVDYAEKLDEKEKGAKGRKRRQDEMDEDLADEEVKQTNSIAETVKMRKEDQSSLYFQMEPFTEAFPLASYRHYVKKGMYRYNIQTVQDIGIWKNIYHCNSPWNAELLVEQLKNEGKFGLVIKKMRGADTEVMGYRVLEGDFEPEQ